MITIGAVYRGPELADSKIQQCIRTISRTMRQFRVSEIGTEPYVNAVFVVGGSIGAPGFDGLEFGKFSAKEEAVVVQIAVDRELLETGSYFDFVFESLHRAISMATPFFSRKGIEFPRNETEEMVEKTRLALVTKADSLNSTKH